jgi:RNA polymerase sigma factor (TIGR02999 family)
MRETCGGEIMNVMICRFKRMEPASLAQLTQLLQAWSRGDRSAEQKLWPIVYGELKRLAQGKLRQERDSPMLQSDALINEVYLRLIDWKDARWNNRAHFFGMCARMMRQILVDQARARGYQKRGGGAHLVALDEIATLSESTGNQMLELDDALTHFARHYPRQSQIVELRFFGGMSVEETAEALQVSSPTVVRDWSFARVWLSSYMKGQLSNQE